MNQIKQQKHSLITTNLTTYEFLGLPIVVFFLQDSFSWAIYIIRDKSSLMLLQKISLEIECNN